MSSALAEAPSGLWVPPRYATARRDPAGATLGPAVAKVARILGKPLIPWQAHQADVAGELDFRGLPLWPLVVTTVQRQTGKTTLELATSVQRCLWRPRQRVWNTAQTGQDARDVWREFTTELMETRLKELVVEWRKGNGQELLRFVNGSTFRPHPPTPDALHGRQSDCNHVDEGWAFDEPTGAALFQAITPTQTTRPGAQTFVWSTMGSAESAWFHKLVDRGLAGDPRMALFYWGIPDPLFPGDPDADPDDPAVIARWHPGVGHITTPEALDAARATVDTPAEYARAYGNRRTGGRERLIHEVLWNTARTEDPLPAGRPSYGVAVYEPRNGGDVSGAIYAATIDEAGRPVVELVETRPGRAWLVDRVLELKDGGAGVACSRRGPAGPVADALELEGVELLVLDGQDEANACQDFWDRLCDADAQEDGPRLLMRAPADVTAWTALDAAADVAGRRWVGKGAWVVDDERSTGDVAPLKAAIAAAWAAARPAEELVVGRSMFG